MSKRTSVVKRRSANPESLMRTYFTQMLVYDLNTLDDTMKHRSRSKDSQLNLMPDSVVASSDTALKATYWCPKVPIPLVRTLVSVSTELLNAWGEHEIHIDDIIGSYPPRLDDRDCEFPPEIVTRNSATVAQITQIAQIMERLTKVFVHQVAILMSITRKYPGITPSIFCKALSMPQLVVSCAQGVEERAAQLTAAKKSKKESVAAAAAANVADAVDDEIDEGDIESPSDEPDQSQTDADEDDSN